jgi:superfamily I DNA and/or RNA helicase
VCSQGLSHTLFERLQRMHRQAISEMLTVQYRMHAAIMRWSSEELYGGRICAHASVAGHTLADLQVHDQIHTLRQALP